MPIKDDPELVDALDGLINAVQYCDDRELHELAHEISGLYQRLGIESPDEDWESVQDALLEDADVGGETDG